MAPSTSTESLSSTPTFESLGIRPIINAQGTYTILSGSRALRQVAEAMVGATNHYVQMDELMERVGARLAELTGAEWGYVSSGCAAALAEITAACITGGDPEKMSRLPDTTGMRDEVIIQQGHRNTYDRAMRLAGARMVEIVTREDLLTAIGERTAMLAVIGDQAHLGEIPVEEMIRVGHAHDIPVLVDAAAERPDVPNRYLAMGADAVAYSGGKCLRGPQASGLVLGRKRLLTAAFLNSAPHHGVGRPMKVGKEEVMGLLAAVEAWVLGRDHAAEWRMWEECLACVRQAAEAIPSVRTEIQQPGVANVTPTLVIRWEPNVAGCTPEWLHAQLWNSEPRIAVHLWPDGIMVNPYMMEHGDAEVLAQRLRELFSGELPPTETGPELAPAVDTRGVWRLSIRYVLGEGAYTLHLCQEGASLGGRLHSPYETVDITGRVAGSEIRFAATLGYQSNRTRYAFCGTVTGDAMEGTVSLGEFGSAEWSATR